MHIKEQIHILTISASTQIYFNSSRPRFFKNFSLNLMSPWETPPKGTLSIDGLDMQ